MLAKIKKMFQKKEIKIVKPMSWSNEIGREVKFSDPNLYNDSLIEGKCPVCGDQLDEHAYGAYLQLSDHKCGSCGFETKCEVLF